MLIDEVPADIEIKPAGLNESKPQETSQNQNSQAGASTLADTNKAPAEGQKPNGGDNGQASKGTPEDSQDIPDEVFQTHLSKKTGGKLKSLADFEAIANEREALLKQVAEGIQPKFKDERAKWAHKLLSEDQGDGLQSAMRTLRALSYDTKGKEGKDVMFESFLLDPKNSDLSPERAREYFEADFDRKYGNADSDVLQKRELDLAIRSATESISKLQNDFKATEEKPLQMAKEVEDAVAKAVNSLKGLKFSFSDNAPETEILNVAIEDPQELQSLQQAMLMPDQAYEALASKFGSEGKPFDYEGFAKEIWKRNNVDKLMKLSQEQGFKLGKLAQLNENRNASNPKDVSKIGQAGGGDATPGSLAEAWQKAQSGR